MGGVAGIEEGREEEEEEVAEDDSLIERDEYWPWEEEKETGEEIEEYELKEVV